jgi:hypothetical protein
MANVRIEDGSKILHTCHNKGADVTEFAAQGIWTCFEELCRYFTDRPFSVRERAPKRRREITVRNRIGEIRRRICSNSPPKFSSAFTSSASNLLRT